MTQDKSTPRPWRVSSKEREGVMWDWGYVLGPDDRPVANTANGARYTAEEASAARQSGTTPPTVEANAALIVSAINSHDAHRKCVEALKTFADIAQRMEEGGRFKREDERDTVQIVVTVRELRRASAALSALEQANG